MSVQVPESDSSDLKTLADALEVDQFDMTIVRPFDGQALLQSLLPLSLTSVPIVVAWINSRVARAKTYKVVIKGIEISGYTAAEASKLLNQLLDE